MTLGMHRRRPAVIAVLVLMAVTILSLPTPGRPAGPIAAFQVDAWSPSVIFAPNSKILACGIALRDVASGKVMGTGDPNQNFPPCTFVAFSPDGQRLASVHFDRGRIGPRHALCLWNITADNQVRKAATLVHANDQPHFYEESLHYLVFSPDSKMLATRLPGDATVVWDTASGKERLRLDTDGVAVAFAPDGRTLTSVSRTGLVQHWDLATGRCAEAEDGARRQDFLFVCNAVASSDGTTLALSDHHSVVLKACCTGKTLRRFDDLRIQCLALSADGKTLAVADSGVLLLDAATGEEKGRLGKQKQSVQTLAFSLDGKFLAVGLEQSVEVWEVGSLARAEKPRSERESVPPLEAKVATRKDTYVLALGRKTAEKFARQFKVHKPLPPSPVVDLVLTLRNTSDKELTLDPKGEFELYLVGDGAVNHPELPYQTLIGIGPGMEGGFPPKPKKITLSPGETYSIPIKSLDPGNHQQQSYWLMPGEYTLHVSYHTSVTPAPAGWQKGEDGTGFGTLRAAPLRLQVVAETK